ncbi:MAG: hypothetical protein ACJ76I_08150 [Gaiellaceae bacterium]
MRVPRWPVLGAVAVSALILSGVATAVGPWPGLARSVSTADGVRYTATRTAGSTTVRAIRGGQVLATTTVEGSFGIPAVTSNGLAGGLSPDGSLLVLAEPPTYQGLRSTSKLAVLATKPLALRNTVALPGEFGFDALSPDGRTLYLIEHKSTSNLIAYRVRAYDLRAERLLSRVIVAKGETATMSGYPVARATPKNGTWVYTLYTRQSGATFVHALNTPQRFAVCIDLPWKPAGTNAWQGRLVLSSSSHTLVVQANGRAVAKIDTRTFRVR